MNQKIKIVLTSISDYQIKTGKSYTNRKFNKKYTLNNNEKTFDSIYELEKYFLNNNWKEETFVFNYGKVIQIIFIYKFDQDKKLLSKLSFSITE